MIKISLKAIKSGIIKFIISLLLICGISNVKAQLRKANEKMETPRKPDSFIRIDEKIVTSKLPHPLIILDGKCIKFSSVNKLDPNKIKKIDVLKVQKSTEVYGAKGINGAIIITSTYTSKELRKLL